MLMCLLPVRSCRSLTANSTYHSAADLCDSERRGPQSRFDRRDAGEGVGCDGAAMEVVDVAFGSKDALRQHTNPLVHSGCDTRSGAKMPPRMSSSLPNAWCFSCGPDSQGRTLHDATTSGRSTIDARRRATPAADHILSVDLADNWKHELDRIPIRWRAQKL